MNKLLKSKKWKFEEKNKYLNPDQDIFAENSFIYINLISEEINIFSISNEIQNEFIILNYDLFLINKENIILKHKKENQFIIIFSYGIIIFWDISKKKIKVFLTIIKKYLKDVIALEKQVFEEFTLHKEKSKKKLIKNNKFYVKGFPLQKILIISYVLAQNIYIYYTHKNISLNLKKFIKVAESLSKNGYIQKSKKSCYKIIGRIFVTLNKITLQKGILDPPRFSFYRSNKKVYNFVRNYFNVPLRSEEMISQINLMGDFYEIILDQVSNRRYMLRNALMLFMVILYSAIHFIWNVVIEKN